MADLSLDMGVIRSYIQVAPDGTSGTIGLIPMILWGTPIGKDTPSRGFMVGPPEYQDMLDFNEALNRATASITATHRPMSWLTQRLVMGFDWTDSKVSQFYPRLPAGIPAFYGSNSQGNKVVDNQRTLNQTLDYNLTATFDVTPDGRRFLIRELSGEPPATPMRVVLNWPALLAGKATR